MQWYGILCLQTFFYYNVQSQVQWLNFHWTEFAYILNIFKSYQWFVEASGNCCYMEGCGKNWSSRVLSANTSFSIWVDIEFGLALSWPLCSCREVSLVFDIRLLSISKFPFLTCSRSIYKWVLMHERPIPCISNSTTTKLWHLYQTNDIADWLQSEPFLVSLLPINNLSIFLLVFVSATSINFLSFLLFTNHFQFIWLNYILHVWYDTMQKGNGLQLIPYRTNWKRKIPSTT